MGQIHLEPLSKGLWTARDAAFLPEGGLTKATNARYNPGDVAIYQAEGRQAVNVTSDPAYLANLVWDPGTQAIQGVPEPYQLLYLDTSDGRRIGTRELLPTAIGAFRADSLAADMARYVGQGPLEAVAMVDRANGDLVNWFLLSGGSRRIERNLVALRGARQDSEDRREQFDRDRTPIVLFNGSTDQRVPFQPGAFILLAVAERLHFGFREAFTQIEFPLLNGAFTGGLAVWEYWNGSTQSWQTLSVTDTSDGFHAQSAFVSWDVPAQWSAASFFVVTGRNLGGTFPTLWNLESLFWVRVRFSSSQVGVAFVERPILTYTTALITRTEQRFIAHGLPESDFSTMSAAATAGAGLVVGTRYWYWWVWADETNNHAGTAADTANVKITAAANARATVSINWNSYEPPASPTHIHLYRGSSVDGSSGEVDSAYPSGVQIFRFPVNAVTPRTTYTFVDAGTSTSSSLPSPWATAQLLSSLGTDFPQAALQDPVTGALIGVPQGGAPPSASTGDVFQESLVLNDLADPRKLRFSYPGLPHSFPSTFYVNLETREADRIVALRTVGSVLGIVTTRGVWRLNWLPRTSDVDFSRGDMLTPVVGDFGASNAAAVTRFSPPGAPIMLAWAGSTGLYSSDLYDWRELVPQFDWSSVGVGQKILVNNPYKSRLELYVPSKNACWYIHYHPSLLQDGIYPVTGPMERPGGLGAAAFMQTSDTTGLVLSSAGDELYYEAQGGTDAATGATLAAQISTREMYLAGMGQEFKVERLLLHTKESWISNPIVVQGTHGSGKPQTLNIIRTGSRRLEAPWALAKTEFVQVNLGARVDEDFGLAVTVVGVEADSLGRRETR